MTNEEAREILKGDNLNRCCKEEKDALDMAIKALEKSTPKLVNYEGDGYADGQIVYDFAHCPNCEYLFEEGYGNWEEPFCMRCGQALEWEVKADDE